jgi:hypothetical protein
LREELKRPAQSHRSSTGRSALQRNSRKQNLGGEETRPNKNHLSGEGTNASIIEYLILEDCKVDPKSKETENWIKQQSQNGVLGIWARKRDGRLTKQEGHPNGSPWGHMSPMNQFNPEKCSRGGHSTLRPRTRKSPSRQPTLTLNTILDTLRPKSV